MKHFNSHVFRRLFAVASVGVLSCVAMGLAAQERLPGPPPEPPEAKPADRPASESPFLSRNRSQPDEPAQAEDPAEAPRKGKGDGDRRFGDRSRTGRLRAEGELGGPRGPDFRDEAFLAVIRDIAPEMASTVEEKLRNDPDGMRQLIMRNGRRLMGLVALRDRSPKLYELKVNEIRLQAEARRIAIDYHDKLASGQMEDAERAKDRLRVASRKAIDANIRSRGEELIALEETVRRFKSELAQDAGRMDAATDEMVKQLLQERPDGSIFSALGGRHGPDDAPPALPPGAVPAGPPVDRR